MYKPGEKKVWRGNLSYFWVARPCRQVEPGSGRQWRGAVLLEAKGRGVTAFLMQVVELWSQAMPPRAESQVGAGMLTQREREFKLGG